ncbi:class I SAM-dependent methyltransferase [Rhizobium sp. ICMP 5592]|uniref:class I SAM-dependent methyltransferase n=1 Tax=Rhizobium sp. ICMP 5592 TaxID=2292445 RepID=UPI0012958126|nr:class I SAM-dependent methyltransferase [Rhizobium sp. ICMP 5592]MQB41482.1 class I SAM-dependent methyltransferase [Rhizobium sp. ICMP 5592]
MKSNVRKFVFHDLQKIDGYIDPPDALVFLSLIEKQKEENLSGGLAEIGVYYGRSYFLLRKLSAPDSNVLAIDLFDIEEDDAQYQRFLDNGKSLGIPVDEELVISGDSTQLDPQAITDKIGQVRFFSIDGGHLLHHVVADSRLAKNVLADHGIIAFDDTFNPAWPEVTIGVSDFLRRNSDTFAAFCMTKYKTYVCRREFHDLYQMAVRDAPHLKPFEQAEMDFLGSKVIRLHNPINRRVAYELMQRMGMSALSEWAYRHG